MISSHQIALKAYFREDRARIFLHGDGCPEPRILTHAIVNLRIVGNKAEIVHKLQLPSSEVRKLFLKLTTQPHGWALCKLKIGIHFSSSDRTTLDLRTRSTKHSKTRASSVGHQCFSSHVCLHLHKYRQNGEGSSNGRVYGIRRQSCGLGRRSAVSGYISGKWAGSTDSFCIKL